MMSKKYILITGVAGLLGSNMADWIINNKKEYGVVGIDNLFGGYIENVNKDVIFYKRDLVTDSLDDIFEIYDIEYVYHFAAFAAEGLSPFMRKFSWQNNVVATANVINHCVNHNVKRLIYTSSMAVYGYGDKNGRFDETLTPKPIDPYGISKYACEMDVKVAGEQFGLDWCIIRPHNYYGVKCNVWDRYRNVLGIWMIQTLQDKPMLVYGDGEQTRAFSYISDALEPLWNAGVKEETSKQIINLGGKTPYSINEAVNIVSEVTGYNKIVHVETRYEAKYAVPTYQKSIDLLGFEDKTNLKEGVTKMWNWVKEQPMRQSYGWDKYEIDKKRIYEYWK
jgi:UDP-glucose 4-epimerase